MKGKLVLPGEQKDPTLTMESTQAKMATDPLTPYDQLLAPPLHGLDHGATLLDRDRSGLFTGCAAVVMRVMIIGIMTGVYIDATLARTFPALTRKSRCANG